MPIRLAAWKWVVLAAPLVAIVGFVMTAAAWQIRAWGINWVWGIVVLVLLGWRWLLVLWTRPELKQMEAALAEVTQELDTPLDAPGLPATPATISQAEAALQQILNSAQSDRPIWDDWAQFWQRCREVVIAIAHIYHPEVKYPLLNIYVPQAYALIRGTVDDVDRWMRKLSPALNQITVGQAVQAYEVYQRLEPQARKLWQVWNWAQWVLNPAAAVARQTSIRSSDRATQQLLVNIGQSLREVALRNLARQAIALYSGDALPAAAFATPTAAAPTAQTQTLQDILKQVEPVEAIAQKPVSILLVGRTGAGKSSLINTLFQADLANVDALPSTDQIQNYQWHAQTGEELTLWDTPGYEQVNRADLREQVLDYAIHADLLLLVTPALDPALQMDVDFLAEIKADSSDLPAIAVVTQVDRLRPLREWNPPYDWQWGDRPKEKSIREATNYRAERLGEFCDRIVPVVTGDSAHNRPNWNVDALSMALVETVDPAKQLRLARFLRNRDARAIAAAQIIDHYTFQMATTQGLAALLKSPVLQFIATLTTGTPTLAYLLAEQIPVEQLPVVIGKLQMAYDLFSLLNTPDANRRSFDLLALWPVLLENPSPPDQNAWAFGHALVEYWTKNLTIAQLRDRIQHYLTERRAMK